ncbi:MAG: RNA 2',3'-cyclic phosphodiesterase [Azonexus sp.]
MPAEAGADKLPERPPTARVFFALWPPAALAEQLAETARAAAGQYGGRPTRQATIHLTLAFLGEVAESRLPEIVRCASTIKAAPFELQLDHLGFWAHNRLLWAGCSVVPPALQQLVGDLQQNLRLAGYPPDSGGHGFTPHLSLLRRVPAARAPAAMAPVAALAMPGWSCHSFVLVRSQLSSLGSDYQIIDEFPLAGRLA